VTTDAAAASLDVSYDDLAALIRRGIAAGLTDDGRIVVASQTRGVSISFGSLSEAIAALERVQALATGAAGIVGMPGGFVSG
jgi:hypothetical protein